MCAPRQVAAADADASTEDWQLADCLFSQTLDGNCDCQCLASFATSDPVCFANDEESGDCDDGCRTATGGTQETQKLAETWSTSMGRMGGEGSTAAR